MEALQDNLGFFYYKEKPQGFSLCISPTEFFCLKPNKRKFIKDNIMVVSGNYLVYSKHSDRYYLRTIHEYTDPYKQSLLMQYIDDRRLYLQYAPESRTNISAHYTQLNLKYGAFVRHNELTLELEAIEKDMKFDEGVKSQVKRIQIELNNLLKHNKRV